MLSSNCIKKIVSSILLILHFGYAKAQTYDAPKLTCVQHRNQNVELTWENPSVSCGPFVYYSIWVSNSLLDPFTLLTTVTNATQTNYIHVGANTTQNWFYFMQSNFNCPGRNSLNSDTIQSTFDFSEPIIKSVSVVNGKAKVTWYPNPEKQTHSYLIFIPQTSLIDSVIGRMNTTYIDNAQDPTKSSVAYSLVAQDKCRGGDYGKSAESYAHATVFLKKTENPCTGNINLEWSSYIGWDAVKDYQIFINQNNKGEKLIATNGSDNKSFIFNNYVVGDSLCIRILARNGNDSTITAYSNQLCFVANKVQKPRYFFITQINVLNKNTTEIEWITDSLANVKTVSILRGFTKDQMSEVGRYSVNGKIPFLSKFKDTSAPSGNLLFYQIALIDSCNASDTSATKNHLHLLATQKLFFENKLVWSPQYLNRSKIVKYILYRKVDNTYEKLTETDSSTNSYIDNIENLINEKGIICYKVEVVYSIDTLPLFSKKYITTSNEMCISQRPLVHVPNAFRPDGVNKVFKPMIIFGNTTNYILQVFNRWGAPIFESRDPEIGWDGTIDGSPAPMEQYPYSIQLNAQNGILITRKGMVTLVR